MIEVFGNLWTFPADWRVISTNGTVKKNGECVMGRGCASEAKAKFPGLAKRLGADILDKGNNLKIYGDISLITFPVKHNWFEKADIELIRQSAVSLETMAQLEADKTFILPRPGCGNGQLKWEDVRPILTFLPDNVKVITFG